MSVVTPDPTYRDNPSRDPATRQRVDRWSGTTYWVVLGFAILVAALALFAALQTGLFGIAGRPVIETDVSGGQTNQPGVNVPINPMNPSGGTTGGTAPDTGVARSDGSSSVPGGQAPVQPAPGSQTGPSGAPGSTSGVPSGGGDTGTTGATGPGR